MWFFLNDFGLLLPEKHCRERVWSSVNLHVFADKTLCFLYVVEAHKEKSNQTKPYPLTHTHEVDLRRLILYSHEQAIYIKKKSSLCCEPASLQFELRSWSDWGKLVSSSCERNLRRWLALHKQAKLCFTFTALKSKPHRSEWASEES